MQRKSQIMLRIAATSVIILGFATLSPTAAEANMTCPTSGFVGCTGHGFCSSEWSEAYCQYEGGPDCHGTGYDCVVWPWNGCGFGEDRPQYFCYGT